MPDPASVLALVRPDILALAPYSSARKEAAAAASAAGTAPRVWLDANENCETPSAHAPLLNRYPEPQPERLLAGLVESRDRLVEVSARADGRVVGRMTMQHFHAFGYRLHHSILNSIVDHFNEMS